MAALVPLALLSVLAGGFAQAREAYERAVATGNPERIAKSLAPLAREAYLTEARDDDKAARTELKRQLRHKAPEVREAAARAFGGLRLEGTSRDLKRTLRKAARGKEPLGVGLAALEAWGEIHDPGSHKELLDLIGTPSPDKSQRALARAAAQALRKYRALDRKQRYQVADELMQTFSKVYALAHRRAKEGSPAVLWWEAIEKEMTAAFRSVTGAHVTEYFECQDWWVENRTRFLKGR